MGSQGQSWGPPEVVRSVVLSGGVVGCVASVDVTVKGACAPTPEERSIKELMYVLPTCASSGTMIVVLKLPLLSVTTVVCGDADGSKPKKVETGITSGQPLPIIVTVVPGGP